MLGLKELVTSPPVHQFAEQSTWLSSEEARACCDDHGDSYYVFHKGAFTHNFISFLDSFTRWYPNTKIAYSYKTNYTPAVCRLVSKLGGCAEVVSEMEFDLARSLGVEGPKIIFNGPCKSLESIRKAVDCGALINIDSIQDFAKVESVASTLSNRKVVVGIRCNFPMEGRELSRFGIDVKADEFRRVVDGVRSAKNLILGGFHCHFPDRDLESFRQRTVGLIEIVRDVFPDGPCFIDLGGGFFGELPDSLRKLHKTPPPTYLEYGEVVGRLCAEAFSQMAQPPTLFLEPGTGLVANTFRFYTRVMDLRSVGTRRIATVAASIQNISPHSRSQQLPVKILRQTIAKEDEPEEETDIAGYTCMESDYLTKGWRQSINVGDVLEYANVGSYSIVMKPPFILPNVPILMIANDSRRIQVIRHKEDPAALFQSFVDTE
jgi:diaminopimelate decarboxylase